MSLYENERDETSNSYLDLSREEKGIYGKRMMDFLGAIDNVKDLKLSSGFLEVWVLPFLFFIKYFVIG